MVAYVTRRLLAALPLLLVALFVVFVLVSVATNPLNRLATCTTCDAAAYDRLVELYELDQPIPQRFLGWLGDAVRGDLGTSLAFGGRPVAGLVAERAVNTAKLAVPAMVVIALGALTLGTYAATHQYRPGDHLTTGFAFLGISMPTFFFALVLQFLLGVWWQDVFDRKPFYVTGMHDGSVGELVSSITLPVVTLALVLTAGESRFQRAAVLESLQAGHVRTAAAKGLTRGRILRLHVLRTALLPLVTIWAIDFAALLGGSIVTETVFAWPGLGPALLTGIFQQDLDLVMAIVAFIAVLTITFNLLADVTYGILDPRIRYD